MPIPECLEGLTTTNTHRLEIDGRTLEYGAETGTLPLVDDEGEPVADMFMVAYTLPRQGDRPRPLTFLCNGGPGSSSIWLHMGGFAPVRVPVGAPGTASAAPYRLIENDACLLEATDLVFLDAVGTGYSRAREGTDEETFFGIDADAAAFTQVIRRYIRSHSRNNDPKFLLGESYGAMRGAIVANQLHDAGIDLNGLILLSGILSFAHFAPQLDQQAIDLLPTFAATAWHHGRVGRPEKGLNALIDEARRFARGDYAQALAQGHCVGAEEQKAVAERLHELTGLSRDWWISGNLRAGIDVFRRELLRGSRQSLGASDTRYVADEVDGVTAGPTIDASSTAVAGPYQAAFEAYVEGTLGCRPRLDYVAGAERIMGRWNWAHKPPTGPKQNALASVVPDLSHAMRSIPGLEVLVLCGYFDLMTPFFGTEYDLGKLFLSPAARRRVQLKHYAAGHMLYVAEEVREALGSDIRAFYRSLLERQQGNKPRAPS